MAAVLVNVLLPYWMILSTMHLSSFGYYVMPSCLDVCQCNDIILRINCSGTMMQELPAHLPEEYHSLYFNDNNFTHLTPDNFNLSSLQHLRELALVNSGVTSVTNGTLSMLTKLISLDMSQNLLHTVPYGISKMTKLQILDMRSNSIKTIPSETFLDHNQLRTLFLDGNEIDLTQIERGTFSSLVKLRKLTMSDMEAASSPSFNAEVSDDYYDNYNSVSSSYDMMINQSVQCVNVASWFDLPKRNLSLLVLTISNSNIQCLAESSFNQWFHKLEILDLSMNQLTSLPDDLFVHLFNLEEVYLQNNFLQHIPAIFASNSNLRILNLKRNQLLFLSPETLYPLSNSLMKLDVSGNYLPVWNATSLTIFDQLQDLSIQRNMLNDEEEPLNFNNIPYLMYLQLDHNKLRHFPNVRRLGYLKTVKISYNRIRFLEEDIFQGCYALEEVYLNSNLLKTIEKSVFHKAKQLREFQISDNPLKCDCNVRWLVSVLVEEPEYVFQYDLITRATCTSPPYLKDKLLVEALGDYYPSLICNSFPKLHHMTWLIAVWLSVLTFVVGCKLYHIFRGSRRNWYICRKRERILEDDQTLIDLLKKNRKVGKYELVRESDFELLRQQSTTSETPEPMLTSTPSKQDEPKLSPGSPAKLDKVKWNTMPETPV